MTLLRFYFADLNRQFEEMMEICNSCAVMMNAPEVVCSGFCKATFHYKCAKVSESFYREICGNPAVFWFCRGCCDLMKSARFKNAMTSTNAATLELKDAYQKVVEDLKTEIKESLIAELKQEIQGGFNKLSPAVLSPVPRHFQFNYRATPKRMRDDDTSGPTEHPPKIFCGTGQSSSNVLSESTSSLDDTFWLYLTRISPEVSENDVLNLAKECLQTSEVVAKSLVPRGKPLSMLSFVSFKVGVNKGHKSKAMDPATWPQGIQFREFVDQESNARHFWKPPQRIDPGASSSNQLQSSQQTSTQPCITLS